MNIFKYLETLNEGAISDLGQKDFRIFIKISQTEDFKQSMGRNSKEAPGEVTIRK